MNNTVGKPVLESSPESPLRLLVPYFILAWILVFWSRFFLTVLPGVGTGDLDRLDILFAVPEILWNNVFPERGPNATSSWAHLSQRFPILGYALFMLAGAFAMGRLALRGMGLRSVLDRVTQTAFAGGLGLSILSLLTLALGKFGFLNRGLFILLLLIPVIVECFYSMRTKNQNVRRSDKSGARDSSLRLIVAGCVFFLAPMLLGAMLPSTDFDVKEYHLGGPKEYFLAGEVHFLPHNVYTSFPFLTEMLTLFGMVLKDDWFTGALVGKTVLMVFAPLTALGIFAVGRRVAGSNAGALGALVYLSTPWAYRISIIAYTEGALCCYVILSLLSLMIWLEKLNSAESSPTQQRAMSLLCGLLAGSAIATKYPGMVLVAIPVAVVMLAIVVIRKIPARQAVSMAALYVVGGVITFGPWVVKNTVETGNPVYPLLYSVFGGEDWDDELNEKWKNGHARPSPLLKSPVAMGQDLKKNVVDVTIGSVWQSPLMFGLAPLALLYLERRKQLWIVIGTAFSMLLVWYTLTHLIDRFWVPVLPVIAVLSGISLVAIREIFVSKERDNFQLFDWLWKGICLLLSLTLIYNFTLMTTEASGYNAYLIDYAAARQHAKPASVQLAEQAVGENGRVLFVGEAMHFDAECEYRYNTVFDHSLLEQWTTKKLGRNEWELLSVEEIAKNFRDEGITHVLVNWNEILRLRTTYGYTDFISPARFEELGERWHFVEIPLPESYNLRDWEGVDDSWKNEIEHWGPELKRTTFTGETMMKQYQLFELPKE